MKSFKHYLKNLDLFHDLMFKKSTGSVKNLSEIFEVSESTVKRMVKDLEYYKEVDIKFCRIIGSYIILNNHFIKRRNIAGEVKIVERCKNCSPVLA